MGLFSKRTPKPVAVDEGPLFTEPNGAELAWMAGHLQFVTAQGVDVIDANQVAGLYDSLLGVWLAVPEGARPDPNDLISALGTAFGEHLVRTTPMRWRVATDVYGVELAVHDEATNALVYPANAVGKRWAERQGGDFIPGISANVSAALRG